MAQHLDDSDYRQILRTDDRLHARGAQVRTRTSKELAGRPAPAKLTDKFRGIIVAGSFSGRYQNGAGRGGQSSE